MKEFAITVRRARALDWAESLGTAVVWHSYLHVGRMCERVVALRETDSSQRCDVSRKRGENPPAAETRNSKDANNSRKKYRP